jgi:hypothetical protein
MGMIGSHHRPRVAGLVSIETGMKLTLSASFKTANAVETEGNKLWADLLAFYRASLANSEVTATL